MSYMVTNSNCLLKKMSVCTGSRSVAPSSGLSVYGNISLYFINLINNLFLWLFKTWWSSTWVKKAKKVGWRWTSDKRVSTGCNTKRRTGTPSPLNSILIIWYSTFITLIFVSTLEFLRLKIPYTSRKIYSIAITRFPKRIFNDHNVNR